MTKENKSEKAMDDNTGDLQFLTFFKYCSDDGRVIEGIFEKHKIRFTQPYALNDPLEKYLPEFADAIVQTEEVDPTHLSASLDRDENDLRSSIRPREPFRVARYFSTNR